jgi:hypothetical protein
MARNKPPALCTTAERDANPCDSAYASKKSTSSSGRLTLSFILRP